MPLEELLPGVAGVVDKPESRPPKRFGRIRGVTTRISRLLYKGTPLASMNEISRLLAQSALGEPHGRHQLLDPGARQRIEAGESVVRRFPRTGSLRQTWKIVSNTQQLTIIPSCHIVGRPWPLMGFAQLPHRRSRPNISPNNATAHRRPRLTTWGRRTTGKARSTPQTNHYQKRDTVSGITGPRARARRQFCLPYTLVGLKGLEPMTSARPEGTHAIDSRYPPPRSHPPAQTRTNGKRSRVRLPAPS